MIPLRGFLILTTILIDTVTVTAIAAEGMNWPVIAIDDLLTPGWRSRFDAGFVIHLLLLATWVAWREGWTAKGYGFGFLSIVMGGMFRFPSIRYASYRAKGDPQAMLPGVHHRSPNAPPATP